MTRRHIILSAILVVFAGWGLIAQTSWGTPKSKEFASQTFAVENMTCAACPITVRMAMSRVDGVQRVDVDFDTETATVIYDPALTDITAIAEAAASVGFPAKAIEGAAP